jgi:2-methylcitrate dehydratase PrpD
MTQTASEKIATFVVNFDPTTITPASRHIAARALFDTVVCAVAGVQEPASQLSLQYANGQTGPHMATVWATGQKLSLEMAALVNGTMGHALDFDDVSSPLRGHPTVAILPAVIALGESLQAQGRDIIDAYVVGFEVTLRLARAIVDEQYAKGWHSTASIATFGATAACAHLLKLNHAQVVNALGITVSQIAGTRQNFGTMSKPFQAGQANAVALRAVMLAKLGFDASAKALDGDQGYTTLYADKMDVHAEFDQLGSLPLEIERSGIEVKKYPLCYATHRTIDGLLDMLKDTPFKFEQIDRVDIQTNYRATVPLIHRRPQTGLEGKFSMQYAVTAALHDGEVVLKTFEDSAVQRADIQAFLPKVSVIEGAPPLYPRWAELAVHLKDGTVLKRRVEKLRGSKEHPLTDAELIVKGADCCHFGGLKISAAELAQTCFTLDQHPLSVLLKTLTTAALASDPSAKKAA